MEWSSVALLVIDMLNDFVKGAFNIVDVALVVSNARKLVGAFHSRGLPVIYVNDAHLKGVDRELDLWGDHAIDGSFGAQVIDELSPQKNDFVVKKRRYSGFFATDLDLLLRELGARRVIFTGVLTDICVQHTVADAFYRGYEVIVVGDATASLTRERHERALKYMEEMYRARVVSTDDIERAVLKP